MTLPTQPISRQRPETPLLDGINDVVDLRRLPPSQLPCLAAELRQFMLYSVARTGGHLGAGLGVVELTIALHYVLHTPYDRLIWDVGHQAYPHKILTGRRDAMSSMRQIDGLAAFPKRSESEFDVFGVGHASTSISALLGMALVDNIKRHHVAVIGDGALTGGMALEALNHMAHCQVDALIIVNDNDMSINANEGGVAHFLDSHDIAGGSQAWFTALGYHYVGPLDGHDLPLLLQKISQLLQQPGRKILHLHTVKGKGYEPAESDPIGYHSINKIEAIDYQRAKKAPTFTQVFGQWAMQQAQQDTRLRMITPAMIAGSGLTDFAKHYSARLYDVAIAEQHAVTLAAGMACAGAKPVVAIYSTFLQRGYDQLVHDVALQDLDVLFAVDRAGVVGEDGATHTGAYDYGYLTCLPNMLIMAPADAHESTAMLHFGYHHQGPAVVRYPRGMAGVAKTAASKMILGGGRWCRESSRQDCVIVNFGALLSVAEQVAASMDTSLVDMRFVKPLDMRLLASLSHYKLWVSLEDHAVTGGAGALVAQWVAQKNWSHKPQLLMLGLPDKVLGQGTRPQVLSACGLDVEGISQAIKRCF